MGCLSLSQRAPRIVRARAAPGSAAGSAGGAGAPLRPGPRPAPRARAPAAGAGGRRAHASPTRYGTPYNIYHQDQSKPNR